MMHSTGGNEIPTGLTTLTAESQISTTGLMRKEIQSATAPAKEGEFMIFFQNVNGIKFNT